MTSQTHLDAQHLLSTNTDIKEAVSGKSILISTLNLTLGLALLSVGGLIEDKTSGLYLATMCTPFFLLIVALVYLIFKRKKLIYGPTGSDIVGGVLYFDKEQLEVIKSMLQADSAENIEWTGFQKHGNARLVYKVSKDAQFAAIQLFEYVPYNYEPASDIFYFTDHRTHPIAQLLLENQHGK